MKLAIGGFIIFLVAVLIMTANDCERPDGSLMQNCEKTAADCAADARC